LTGILIEGRRFVAAVLALRAKPATNGVSRGSEVFGVVPTIGELRVSGAREFLEQAQPNID
jgi:hypothetical protein